MSATVCPFLAIAGEPARRSSIPDRAHACFAAKPATPVDLAQQERYCLDPGFASCPSFLPWAAREAAQPLEILRGVAQAVDVVDLVAEGARQQAFTFQLLRVALAVQRAAGRHAHPAFADAVLGHVEALLAVEGDADIAFEDFGAVVGAARVDGQAVRPFGGRGLGGVAHVVASWR